MANLSAKQALFLMALDSDNTDNIMNLDLTHSKLNLNIREMIIDINDLVTNKCNFFTQSIFLGKEIECRLFFYLHKPILRE